MTKHSNLGASSAYRWMNCPGSVQLIESLPFKPQSSVYAQEGTNAHKLAELCLANRVEPMDFIGVEEVNSETGEVSIVSEDMAQAVQIYTDYIRNRINLGGDLTIEVKFDLSHIFAGMFGTSDAVLNFDFLGELEVVDYKHGAGIAIDPEENPQLKYYALGAVSTLNVNPETKVRLTIVQPRTMGAPIKTWITSVSDLLDFSDQLKEAATKTKEKNAPLAVGDWCKFCNASPICPQMKKRSLEIARAAFDDKKQIILPQVNSLRVPELKEILDFSDILSKWLESVNGYALELADRGTRILGYKLVAKRAHRKWRDENETKEILSKLGIEYRTEPKLKSPAQIEAMKVEKSVVSKLTVIPDNGVTLVSDTDKRQEVKPTKTVSAAFGGITIDNS